MKIEGQLSERIIFEQGESQRRLEQALLEKDTEIDHLIEDNRSLLSSL